SVRTLAVGALILSAGCSCNRGEPNTVIMPTAAPPPPSVTTPMAKDVEVPPGQPTLLHARNSVYLAVHMRAAPVPPPPCSGLQIPLERYVVVDQFGYLPSMKKVAILVNPIHGWNAADAYIPGPTLEVRKWESGETVFTGKPVDWNNGAEDATA